MRMAMFHLRPLRSFHVLVRWMCDIFFVRSVPHSLVACTTVSSRPLRLSSHQPLILQRIGTPSNVALGNRPRPYIAGSSQKRHLLTDIAPREYLTMLWRPNVSARDSFMSLWLSAHDLFDDPRLIVHLLLCGPSFSPSEQSSNTTL